MREKRIVIDLFQMNRPLGWSVAEFNRIYAEKHPRPKKILPPPPPPPPPPPLP